MSFYYVKNGGTADGGDGGRYATAQTGTWFGATTAYYSDVAAAFGATTPPAAGDHIYCSDSHNIVHGVAQSWGVAGVNNIYVGCIADGDMNTSSTGGIEDLDAGGYNLDLLGAGLCEGLTIKIGNDFEPNGDSGWTFKNCALDMQGSGDVVLIGDANDIGAIFEDMTITWPSGTTAAAFVLQRGAVFHMIGGAVVATANDIDTLIDGSTDNGICAIFERVNLGDCATITDTQGAGYEDTLRLELRNCETITTPSFAGETFVKAGQELLAFGCGGDAAAEYQFFKRTSGGDIQEQDDTGIHRSESTAFPSGEQVSMLCTANSTCSIANPLVIDLHARNQALSTASTDTVRIYLASSTSLTDANCWAQIYYADGTNIWVTNTFSNRNADIIISAGTAITTDVTSIWNNTSGETQYQMDITTADDVAADQIALVRVFIAVASAVVYIDTTIDAVAP